MKAFTVEYRNRDGIITHEIVFAESAEAVHNHFKQIWPPIVDVVSVTTFGEDRPLKGVVVIGKTKSVVHRQDLQSVSILLA